MRATRRRHLLGLVAAGLVLWPAVAGAQSGVNLTLMWNQPDIQSFYLSDFDPTNTAVHPDLFTIRLDNSSGVVQNIYLRFQITFIDANGGGEVELVSAETNPFDLDPGVIFYSNRDLSKVGEDYSLRDYNVNTDQAESIVDQLLKTGVLPSGRYTFFIDPFYSDDTSIPGASYPLTVSNPSRVELLGPGAEFGGILPVIATSNPQFFWTSDAMTGSQTGSQTVRFQIKVVAVGDASTAEEAMQGFANWQKEVQDQTTVVYPASVEAIPLQAGETYAWQVSRIVSTSGGEREIESEIHWFQLQDISAGLTGASVDEEVAAMMEQILSLQGVSQQMAGFTPSGTVLVDGKPVSLNALRPLLTRILSGEIQILSLIIR